MTQKILVRACQEFSECRFVSINKLLRYKLTRAIAYPSLALSKIHLFVPLYFQAKQRLNTNDYIILRRHLSRHFSLVPYDASSNQPLAIRPTSLPHIQQCRLSIVRVAIGV